MAELIQLQELQHSFGQGQVKHQVLHGISLSIQDGESVAITGPSGSGKSTLLSILGLLDTATAGQYLLRNQPVGQLSRQQKSQVRNRHIGWIFQNFNLIADMTALENVALPLRFNPEVPNNAYRQRAADVLGQVGLADKLHARPSELSGGQQQRVAIARALVNKPGLILADEPTGNLDSATGQSIMDLLLQLATEGSALVMVTHDPTIASQCQRSVHLVDGRLSHAK
ncbi:ATP-binding cassette domain-containing protein [Alkalimonas sp.]|uniref:ABC transporter ATP-binding protein n=1 Tax=Alkalimonas sp. TaxID=1872453 RepID=UPI0034559889